MESPNYLIEITGLRKEGIALKKLHPQVPTYTLFALELQNVYSKIHETSKVRSYSAHTNRLDKIVERLAKHARVLDGKGDSRPYYDSIMGAVKRNLKLTNGDGHVISDDEKLEQMLAQCDEDADGFIPTFDNAYGPKDHKVAAKRKKK